MCALYFIGARWSPLAACPLSPSMADMKWTSHDVRQVPEADIRGLLVSRDNQQNNTTDYNGNRGN